MTSKTTQFFKGISTQSIITIVMGVMEVIVFAIISRLLSKTDFGYYAAISGVVAIFMSISEAGLGSTIVQKKNANSEFISTAFSWSLTLGLFAAILVFVLSPTLATLIADDTLTTPLRLMAITILFHSIISVGNGILYRKLAFKTVGLLSVISYFIASVVSIVMATKGMGLIAVVALHIVNSVVYILLLTFCIGYPRLSIRKQETKEIISYGGWLTLGVIVNNITHQLDKLLLPRWMSVSTLGAYNRPAGFVSTISNKINGIFDTVLFPMLSDLQNDSNRVKGVLLKSVSLLNGFFVILAAIFFFNAHLIISIFFGTQWLDMVPVMQIISLSVIFNVNSRLVDCFFRSLAFVKIGFFLRIISAIVTFTSIYVGSQFGVNGVAFSIVIANIINILTKVVVLAIKTRVSVVDVLCKMVVAWKVVIPILIIGVPFLIIDSHTWLINIIFALIFAVVVMAVFAFYPQFVGEEYVTTVYPMVEKIKSKIVKKQQ